MEARLFRDLRQRHGRLLCVRNERAPPPAGLQSQWQDRCGCAGGRHAVDRRPCRSDDRCEGRWRFHRQAGAWRGHQRVRGQAGIRGQWRGCARTDLPSCAAARSEPDGRRHHRERRPVLRLRNHDSAACGYGFASERDGGRRRGPVQPVADGPGNGCVGVAGARFRNRDRRFGERRAEGGRQFRDRVDERPAVHGRAFHEDADRFGCERRGLGQRVSRYGSCASRAGRRQSG